MAFLSCVGFCGYGVMRKLASSVVCPLMRRYIYGEIDDQIRLVFASEYNCSGNFRVQSE